MPNQSLVIQQRHTPSPKTQLCPQQLRQLILVVQWLPGLLTRVYQMA